MPCCFHLSVCGANHNTKQIRKTVKGAKGKVTNKNVVGKGNARNDSSIEEMQKNTATAPGLDEVTKAGNGTASEESKPLVASPPSPAPTEGGNGTKALAALLAAQAAPAE